MLGFEASETADSEFAFPQGAPSLLTLSTVVSGTEDAGCPLASPGAWQGAPVPRGVGHACWTQGVSVTHQHMVRLLTPPAPRSPLADALPTGPSELPSESDRRTSIGGEINIYRAASESYLRLSLKICMFMG